MRNDEEKLRKNCPACWPRKAKIGLKPWFAWLAFLVGGLGGGLGFGGLVSVWFFVRLGWRGLLGLVVREFGKSVWYGSPAALS